MSNVYFAKDKAEKAVTHIISKADQWYTNIQLNKYIEKLHRSYNAYGGVFYENAHEISYGGEQGELVNLAVNHYRNLATNILNMVTGSRPSFQSRAVNTDRKSLIQAQLANGLLDYYMREKRLERFLKEAVEMSIVLGSGFIKMEWNSTKGEIKDVVEVNEDDIAEYDEDDRPLDADGNILEDIPIYEGDIEFKVLSPLDVVYDSTKENPEYNDWVLTRSYENKHDLAAKYPEMKEKILGVKTKDKVYGRRMSLTPFDETVDVPVYEFFHEKTVSMPEGRYILYLESDIILEDTVMVYDRLPVYRIAPANILGTPYGYSPMFDILPLQDSVNSLYSTIMTNQNAFGVQNILIAEGSDVKVNQMEGGLNFVKYNPMPHVQGGGRPESLNLTNTPGEVFNFLQTLETKMETLTGVNSVARGNPERQLSSGNALALVQSQALQFQSGLQQSYVQLMEDVGTGVINLLKKFANEPRIAAIVGINNSTKLKEFSSADIQDINRVVVDVGNALMNSTAGRAEVAMNLLQMMPERMTPEKYIQVLNTGNLDILTEGIMNEMDTIRDENETLIKGGVPIGIATDDHVQHINEHKDVIANQGLREDADLVARTLKHIQEHLDLMRTTDPDLLSIIGSQPLGPQGGSPAGPPQGQAPEGPGAGFPDPNAPPPTADGSGVQPAKPPGEFADSPQTPEDLMKQNS